jgi:hypothetical protein
MASPKQSDFARKLVTNIQNGVAAVSAQTRDEIIATLTRDAALVSDLVNTPDLVGGREASRVIDTLIGLDREIKAAALASVEVPTRDEVDAFLAGLGRKVAVEDVTPALVAFATEFARAYTGTFDFLRSAQVAAERGPLSDGQAKGVLNCVRAENNRKVEAAAPTADLTPGDVLWSDSLGAVVKVVASKTGNLYGKVRVAGSWEYGGKAALANLRPLTAEEAAAFGHSTGECVFCSRELEDDRSVTVGYGPVCAKRYGLPWG